MQQQPDQPNPQAQTSYVNQPKASYPEHPQSQEPEQQQQGYPAPYPPPPQQQQGYPQQQQQGYPQQQQQGYPQQQQQSYPQQQQQGYPQQQQGYPAPYPPLQQGYPQQQQQMYPPPPMMQQTLNVNVQQGSQHGFITRALYFIFIGWWFGFFWLNLGFALCATVILLPLGLIMLNRLPQVLTLQAPKTSTNVSVSNTTVQGAMGGPAFSTQTINVNVSTNSQYNFLIRALYFLFIGWWVGYCWAILGYWCCISIILLPVGVMMLNSLPAVLTLRKN